MADPAPGFGRSISKGVGISRRTPKNWGSARAPPPWDRGVADPLQTRPSLTWVTMSNLIAVGQRYERTMEIRLKKTRFLHPAFQGHSRSSEPTLIDRLPMTSY